MNEPVRGGKKKKKRDSFVEAYSEKTEAFEMRWIFFALF